MRPDSMAPPTKTTDPGAGPEPADGVEGGLRQAGDLAEPPGMALGMGAGDRCAVCGTHLAGDQRYCLECGERRGKARFAAIASSPRPERREPKRARRAPGLSAGTTLIAGVGTLLLALGIGVLIGRSANSSTPQASSSKVQVVTVGGGAGVGTAASAASSGSGGSSAKHGKSHKSNKSSAKAATTPTTAAPTASTVKNLPPPTVTIGAKGHGPGYTHGHFTGKFFGP